jgi:membrane-associated phospholipid phosphatase
MSRTGWLTELRVEDVLCAVVAVALGGYAGAGMLLRSLGEEQYWTVSFILLPVSILIFLAALRYALGGTSLGAFARTSTDAVRDWLPFAIFLLVYSTFHARIWSELAPHDRDAELLALDRTLFGTTPAAALQTWANPALTDILVLCYFLHLVLPPVMAALWYRRDLRVFREFLLAILVAGILGTIGYIVVPATGPALAYPRLFQRELTGALYQPVLGAIDLARAPRDAFPSLHVAVSAIVLWYAWRRGRAVFAAVLPLVLGNWLSTLYLRYHYFVDVMAGWAVAAASVAASGWLLRIEARFRSDQVRGGEADLGAHHH